MDSFYYGFAAVAVLEEELELVCQSAADKAVGDTTASWPDRAFRGMASLNSTTKQIQY